MAAATAPLLEAGGRLGAEAYEDPVRSGAKRHLSQRLASWHGPRPTTALRVVAILASAACLQDYRLQFAKGSAPANAIWRPAAESLVAVAPSGSASTSDAAAAHWVVALGVLVVAFAGAELVMHLISGSICRGVLRAIARFNASFGLGLRVRDVDLLLFRGRLVCSNVVVGNPEGYGSAFLIKADKVVARLNMRKLFCSLGAAVEVKELWVDGVDVAVAQHTGGLSCASNVQAVIEKMEEVSSKSKAGIGCQALNVKKVHITTAAGSGTRETQGTAELMFRLTQCVVEA